MTKVFDASVVVKMLTEEPLSALAASVIAAEEERLAPDFLRFEIASALSKKARYAGLPQAMIDRALAALPGVIDELVSAERLISSAMALSIELRHALYDCLYLALAEMRDCMVVTADDKFAKVVEASRLSHRLQRLSDHAL